MKLLVVSVAMGTLTMSAFSTQPTHRESEPLVTYTTVSVPPSTLPVVTTTTSTTTSTTSTTTTTLPDTQCAEWYGAAMQVGWAHDQWDRLSKIIYRESRCINDVHNAEDPQGGSLGLMQINKFWCRPQHGAELGWLQQQGVLQECTDLLDPATNLLAALHIYNYSLQRHEDGWRPWRK